MTQYLPSLERINALALFQLLLGRTPMALANMRRIESFMKKIPDLNKNYLFKHSSPQALVCLALPELTPAQLPPDPFEAQSAAYFRLVRALLLEKKTLSSEEDAKFLFDEANRQNKLLSPCFATHGTIMTHKGSFVEHGIQPQEWKKPMDLHCPGYSAFYYSHDVMQAKAWAAKLAHDHETKKDLAPRELLVSFRTKKETSPIVPHFSIHMMKRTSTSEDAVTLGGTHCQLTSTVWCALRCCSTTPSFALAQRTIRSTSAIRSRSCAHQTLQRTITHAFAPRSSTSGKSSLRIPIRASTILRHLVTTPQCEGCSKCLIDGSSVC